MARKSLLPSASTLRRSHAVYMDWLWEYWGYSRWKGHSAGLIFWYGAAGAPIASGSADKFLVAVENGKLHQIPSPKRKLWRSAVAVVADIRRATGMELVPWVAQARAELAWKRLQKVYLIGPKIASWILRDISLLMDHCVDASPSRFSYDYKKRNASWFHGLSLDCQKYFIPIDRWVFRGAKKAGSLSTRSIRGGFRGVQANHTRYLDASHEIATFCQTKGLDPRDLDTYWFAQGSGWIDEKGYELEE